MWGCSGETYRSCPKPRGTPLPEDGPLPRSARTLLFGTAALLVVGLLTGGIADAKPRASKGGGSASTGADGWDVSYPQCGGSLPSAPAFGIVGVNGGKPYSSNTCFSTQWAWAQRST